MTPSLSLKAAIAALAFCGFAAMAAPKAGSTPPATPSGATTQTATPPADRVSAPADRVSSPTDGASAPADSVSAPAKACATCGRLDWLPSATVIGVALLFLAGAAGTMSALKHDPKWSLAAALSEKDPSASKTQQADGSATSTSSSSRLIAFFGMIAMLAYFAGFGSFLLWAFFNGRDDEANKAFDAFKSYFLCGTALYAPYALNQLKSAFK
jgi:hypothetical protein